MKDLKRSVWSVCAVVLALAISSEAFAQKGLAVPSGTSAKIKPKTSRSSDSRPASKKEAPKTTGKVTEQPNKASSAAPPRNPSKSSPTPPPPATSPKSPSVRKGVSPPVTPASKPENSKHVVGESIGGKATAASPKTVDRPSDTSVSRDVNAVTATGPSSKKPSQPAKPPSIAVTQEFTEQPSSPPSDVQINRAIIDFASGRVSGESLTRVLAGAVPPRPTPPILFDHLYGSAQPTPTAASGVHPYLMVYQTDFDAQSMSTGRIDTVKVIADIDRQIAQRPGLVWGCLDYEVPFDDVLEHGPTHPLYATVVESLVTTIRVVKERYPNMMWSYWNMPRIRYWVNGTDWAALTAEQRASNMDRVLDCYAPIMMEMDWFTPNCYDYYEEARQQPPSASARRDAEVAFRVASVVVVKRWFDRARLSMPPVVPFASRWFQPGGVATSLREIPILEFVEEQVRPCIESGAQSVALWGCMNYFVSVAFESQGSLPVQARIDSAMMRTVLDQDYGIRVDDSQPINPSDIALHKANIESRMNLGYLEAIGATDSIMQGRQP